MKSFEWKEDKKADFNPIAEEVHELFPELVIYDDEGKPDSIKDQKFGTLLIPVVKKLHDELQEKETRIQKLEKENKKIKATLSKLVKDMESVKGNK